MSESLQVIYIRVRQGTVKILDQYIKICRIIRSFLHFFCRIEGRGRVQPVFLAPDHQKRDRKLFKGRLGICCCVSATQTGKEMQFFGARANLAKCLLYAINGGVDEKSHEQCGPNYAPITSEYLNYDEVLPKYVQMLDWLAGLYVNVLNLIQYMHDKYYYEEAEMALIDTDVRRTFATGIAGFSHVIDSLSAIKYAKVKVVRDETGLATGYEVEGDFPKYGNDDDRADEIGVWLLRTFLEMIKKRHTYRNSEATTSILTITSNGCTASTPVLCPMVVPPLPPLHPVQTPATVRSRTACWLL